MTKAMVDRNGPCPPYWKHCSNSRPGNLLFVERNNKVDRTPGYWMTDGRLRFPWSILVLLWQTWKISPSQDIYLGGYQFFVADGFFFFFFESTLCGNTRGGWLRIKCFFNIFIRRFHGCYNCKSGPFLSHIWWENIISIALTVCVSTLDSLGPTGLECRRQFFLLLLFWARLVGKSADHKDDDFSLLLRFLQHHASTPI